LSTTGENFKSDHLQQTYEYFKIYSTKELFDDVSKCFSKYAKLEQGGPSIFKIVNTAELQQTLQFSKLDKTLCEKFVLLQKKIRIMFQLK